MSTQFPQSPQLVVIQPGRNSIILAESERDSLRKSTGGGYQYLPIELIRTERSCYVFDARNVCFIAVDSVAFEVLTVLRERSATIADLVLSLPQFTEGELRRVYQDFLDAQRDGFLLPYKFRRRAQHANEEYEEILSKRMGGFTIFVTTRCNLACSYCIYGGQYEQHEKLSETPMPWETVKATMDFLAQHSYESEQVRVDFFGGEPLLAFPMIERGVNYLKSILTRKNPQVFVTITRNGTILNDRILDFLLENDVYLQISVDASKVSHDRARPFKGTMRGSYEIILRNLQRIYDCDPHYFQARLRLKGVLTTENVDADDEDFYQHALIGMLMETGRVAFVNLEPHYDLSKDSDYFERTSKLGQRLLEVRGAQTERDLLAGLNPKQRALYHSTLGLFFDAQAIQKVYFEGDDSVPFIKGCLTGYQEGAVAPNGDISICLKSAKGENFVIGNVLQGTWYFDKIKQLNTLFHEDWPGCSSCFVQNFCDLCYEKLNGDVGQWATAHTKFCDFNRKRYRVIFECMLRVAENNPALWQHVDHLIETKLKQREQCSHDDAAKFASRNILGELD